MAAGVGACSAIPGVSAVPGQAFLSAHPASYTGDSRREPGRRTEKGAMAGLAVDAETTGQEAADAASDNRCPLRRKSHGAPARPAGHLPYQCPDIHLSGYGGAPSCGTARGYAQSDVRAVIEGDFLCI